jgi:hypothetical protein
VVPQEVRNIHRNTSQFPTLEWHLSAAAAHCLLVSFGQIIFKVRLLYCDGCSVGIDAAPLYRLCQKRSPLCSPAGLQALSYEGFPRNLNSYFRGLSMDNRFRRTGLTYRNSDLSANFKCQHFYKDLPQSLYCRVYGTIEPYRLSQRFWPTSAFTMQIFPTCCRLYVRIAGLSD